MISEETFYFLFSFILPQGNSSLFLNHTFDISKYYFGGFISLYRPEQVCKSFPNTKKINIFLTKRVSLESEKKYYFGFIH